MTLKAKSQRITRKKTRRGMRGQVPRPFEQVTFYHNGELSGSSTDRYILGYTLYTYLKIVGEVTGIDDKLKMLAFDSIVPSVESIADGYYS